MVDWPNNPSLDQFQQQSHVDKLMAKAGLIQGPDTPFWLRGKVQIGPYDFGKGGFTLLKGQFLSLINI